jgi:hypothetical protein
MTQGSIRKLKVLLFLICLLPLSKLALETFAIAGLSLGANPIEELIHRFGIWGLNFLLITLAVTPLRRLTGNAAAGSAGGDFHQCHDAAAGPALAETAPARLPDRHAGRVAFLLAG